VRVDDLLRRLDGVRSRGPAHNPDRHPSLSICDGDKGILLRCWSGCELHAITDKLGIQVKDLFYDRVLDPRHHREAMQRRVKEQTAKQAVLRTTGMKNDLLRQSEYLIQSARGLHIEHWSDAELDKRLNTLADAYRILEGEHYDA